MVGSQNIKPDPYPKPTGKSIPSVQTKTQVIGDPDRPGSTWVVRTTRILTHSHRYTSVTYVCMFMFVSVYYIYKVWMFIVGARNYLTILILGDKDYDTGAIMDDDGVKCFNGYRDENPAPNGPNGQKVWDSLGVSILMLWWWWWWSICQSVWV